MTGELIFFFCEGMHKDVLDSAANVSPVHRSKEPEAASRASVPDS